MKKKTVIFVMAICALLSVGVVVVDYYRATFVSEKVDTPTEQAAFSSAEKEERKTVEAVMERSGIASVCIFGDQLIHENVMNDANRNAGGTGDPGDYTKGFSFVEMYNNVKEEILDADFAICTQNTLVGANDSVASLSGYPLFNAPEKLGHDLIEIGFDAVNIASNHLLDLSDRGYRNSVEFWNENDIKLIGGYTTQEQMNDLTQKIVEVQGVKIGILAYTASTNGLYPTNESTALPLYTFKGSAVLSDKLKREVAGLKAISDAVIVLINWGSQAGFEITDQQKETAQILVNSGADLIVGNGATVIQKIEYLESADGGHTGICAYSLGNTLCTMQYMNNLLGGFLTFDVVKDNGNGCIQNVVFTPTVIHYDESIRNIAVIPLAEYSEDLFYEHGSNILYGFGEYRWMFDVMKQYIPLELLPASIRIQ